MDKTAEHYFSAVKAVYAQHANPEIAKGQKAYMRDLSDYFGIKTPIRRSIQAPFLVKSALPPKVNLEELIHAFWNEPQRELQYFGQELFKKYVKTLRPEDMDILEYMVVHKSWWDTVDLIAAQLMGPFFLKYPELRKSYVKTWLASGNMWLQRSAIIFQLKYKDKTDTKLLAEVIQSLLGSKEFFINKAIGWALREYGKTNPDWVRDFAEQTQLEPLSRREALRRIS